MDLVLGWYQKLKGVWAHWERKISHLVNPGQKKKKKLKEAIKIKEHKELYFVLFLHSFAVVLKLDNFVASINGRIGKTMESVDKIWLLGRIR